jgi:PST family polysaccharide transporter
VLFPALSSIKHDKPRLRAAYRNAQATIFGLALPISLGMTFYAREIILVLFGAKWLPAAIPLEILAPALAIGTLGAATTSLAMALGEVRGLFVRAAIELAIAYPAIYVGIEVAGLAGAALGVAVYMLATTAMNLLFVGRMIGQRLLAPLGASYRSVTSAAAMIGSLALVSPPFDAARSTGAQLAQLVALVALGASVYAAFHYALWRLAGRPTGFEENLLHYSGRLARRLTRRRT